MDITMILLAVFVLFMIWSIYSGTKRQKAQMQATQTMQENLRAGDEIMTRAGLYGTIVSTDHENRKALVEIAEGTIITISLDAVATVVDVWTLLPPWWMLRKKNRWRLRKKSRKAPRAKTRRKTSHPRSLPRATTSINKDNNRE